MRQNYPYMAGYHVEGKPSLVPKFRLRTGVLTGLDYKRIRQWMAQLNRRKRSQPGDIR